MKLAVWFYMGSHWRDFPESQESLGFWTIWNCKTMGTFKDALNILLYEVPKPIENRRRMPLFECKLSSIGWTFGPQLVVLVLEVVEPIRHGFIHQARTIYCLILVLAKLYASQLSPWYSQFPKPTSFTATSPSCYHAFLATRLYPLKPWAKIILSPLSCFFQMFLSQWWENWLTQPLSGSDK